MSFAIARTASRTAAPSTAPRPTCAQTKSRIAAAFCPNTPCGSRRAGVGTRDNPLGEIPTELQLHMKDRTAWFWRMRDIRDYIAHHGFVHFHLVESPAGTLQFFRSEEHTSELQSLLRFSYAVFCLLQIPFLIFLFSSFFLIIS